MRLVIDPIACENDAFLDAPREECASILRNLAARLADGSEDRGGLFDSNENRVASWRLED